MWKSRASLLLATLMVCSACTSTRTGLKLGDRIRITASGSSGQRVVGSYEDRLADDLVIVSEGDTMTISRFQIVGLEREDRTHDKRNLLGIVGLLAGGAIAWATLEDNEPRRCSGRSFADIDLDCAFWAEVDEVAYDVGAVARVGLGAVVGGVVGALVGSALHTERWVVVPLIEVGSLRGITSAAVWQRDRRFALGVSVR